MKPFKRLSIAMYVTEIVCAILIAFIALWALGEKGSAVYASGLALVLTSSPLLFQCIIEKLFDENLPVTHNLINIFLNNALYFLIFSITLLAKGISILTVITIVLLQIMYLTFRFLSEIVKKFSTARKVTYNLLFFIQLVMGLIYGFKNKLDFLKLFIVILPIPILISIILVWFYLYSDKKNIISK